MSLLQQKFSHLPCAHVVPRVLGAFSGRLPAAVTLSEVESVAWVAYHDFILQDAAGLSPDDMARHLYVVVRRAIVDELRRLDPLRRHTRRRAKHLRSVQEELRRELGRDPTMAEVALVAGVDEKSARRVLEAAAAASAEANHASMEAAEYIGTPDSVGDPLSAADAHDVEAVLRREIASLPALQRYVLQRNLLDGVQMADVAKEINRTPTGAGQIRDKGLMALRRRPAVRELRS